MHIEFDEQIPRVHRASNNNNNKNQGKINNFNPLYLRIESTLWISFQFAFPVALVPFPFYWVFRLDPKCIERSSIGITKKK